MKDRTSPLRTGSQTGSVATWSGYLQNNQERLGRDWQESLHFEHQGSRHHLEWVLSEAISYQIFINLSPWETPNKKQSNRITPLQLYNPCIQHCKVKHYTIPHTLLLLLLSLSSRPFTQPAACCIPVQPKPTLFQPNFTLPYPTLHHPNHTQSLVCAQYSTSDKSSPLIHVNCWIIVQLSLWTGRPTMSLMEIMNFS